MGKKKRVKVKQIELQIGDEAVSLTPDEARALLAELKALLGGEVRQNWWYTYPSPAPTITPPYRIAIGDTGTITTTTTSGDTWVTASPVTSDTVSAYQLGE